MAVVVVCEGGSSDACASVFNPLEPDASATGSGYGRTEVRHG